MINIKDFKIVIGGDDNKNRKAVENKNIDILLSPEKTRKQDFMHYRDSGLNQVLCKLAYKNKVAIGFNFDDVLDSRDRASVLGKMMQNVKLCRKYNARMVIVSDKDRSKQELVSFSICMGMTPGEAGKAMNLKRKD